MYIYMSLLVFMTLQGKNCWYVALGIDGIGLVYMCDMTCSYV